MKKKVDESDIVQVLKDVLDPELQISIWDLGLIYSIAIKDGDVHIVMTLTSIGCPLFTVIQKDMEAAVQKVPGVRGVTTELTFDPPWNMDKMSIEAKTKLGIE